MYTCEKLKGSIWSKYHTRVNWLKKSRDWSLMRHADMIEKLCFSLVSYCLTFYSFLCPTLPSPCPLLSSCSLHFPPLTILLPSMLTARDNSMCVCIKDEPTSKLDLVKKNKNLNLSSFSYLCNFKSVHLSSSAKPFLSPFLSCPYHPTLLTSFTTFSLFSFFFHALPPAPLVSLFLPLQMTEVCFYKKWQSKELYKGYSGFLCDTVILLIILTLSFTRTHTYTHIHTYICYIHVSVLYLSYCLSLIHKHRQTKKSQLSLIWSRCRLVWDLSTYS